MASTTLETLVLCQRSAKKDDVFGLDKSDF